MNRRLNHFIQDLLRVCRRKDSTVAIGSHASRVWSRIPVVNSLVILRRLERNKIAAVAQDNEADLFSLQKLLEDQTRSKRMDGSLSFQPVMSDDHSFSCGQT